VRLTLGPELPLADCRIRIQATDPIMVTAEHRQLHDLIPQRRTHRRIYRSHTVAESDLQNIQAAAGPLGAQLRELGPNQRRRVAVILNQARQQQLAEDFGRLDHETWLRPDQGSAEPAADGIGWDAALGGICPILPPPEHPQTPDQDALVSEFGRSTVLMLLTDEDTREHWVRAGMALEAALLAATTRGLVAEFLGQSLAQPQVREKIRGTLNSTAWPQVLLRIGRPIVPAHPTGRRGLADLLLDPTEPPAPGPVNP
jgi:hypothetical protein